MVALGLGLTGVAEAQSGHPPHGPLAVLVLGMLSIGFLRLTVGLPRGRKGALPNEQPAGSASQAPGEERPEERPPAPALNPLVYDYWVLGLTPDASFREVRGAYRQRRAAWMAAARPGAEYWLAECQAAYRRLRRLEGVRQRPGPPQSS